EKIVKLYNEYLSKLQSDPSVTKASLNIPEEIDHNKFNLNNLKFDNEIYKYFKNDEAIINLQNEDALLKNLKEAIQYNKHGKWTNLRMFHTAKKNLFVINNLLIWYRPNDNKILPCVTKEYITDLIIKLHTNNHEGIPKVQNRVKKIFYYPSIEFLTSEIISSCPVCQLIKPNIGPNKPRLPNLEVKADYALDHCMGDLTFLQKNDGNVGLFVIIDIASRRCFAEPIRNKTSSEVIKAFKRIIDAQMFGSTIKILRVDNGTEFTSKEFKEFCKSIGTKLTFGNSFSSKSGGLVERLNGTIKQLIKQLTIIPPMKCLLNYLVT
ncbi:unnamed protein product, partial [Rotaria magnacalcarata]